MEPHPQSPSLNNLQEQRSKLTKVGYLDAVNVLDSEIMDSKEYQKIKDSQTEGESVSFSNIQVALIESLDSVFKRLPELVNLEEKFLPVYFNAEDFQYSVDVEKGSLTAEVATSQSVLTMYKMMFLYQNPRDSWGHLLKDEELYEPLRNLVHTLSSQYEDNPIVCMRKLLEEVFSVSTFENIDQKVESVKKLYYKKS